MDNKISINKIIADIKATKGNRSGCQGLHSSLESDGYITSICKWTRATSPERIDALVEHVEKQDAALIAWEKTMMEVCGEDSPASVASEIRSLRTLRDTAMQALKSQVKQLAAENVGLNKFIKQSCYVYNGDGSDISDSYIPAHESPMMPAQEQSLLPVAAECLAIRDAFIRYLTSENLANKPDANEQQVYDHCAKWVDAMCETPVTDSIYAAIKADGRVEGINFAASRLAAAFNHGFVDKPMAEVFDVVRMILTAKEDLASNPAEDGLSGEYAEKSLAEWEAALREGAR